jgi:hypothetical protein
VIGKPEVFTLPRRSAASLSVTAFNPGLQRLLPPTDMQSGSLERRLFLETVSSVAAVHFAAEDGILLAEYARTAALAQRASSELAACATMGDRASPWLEVHSAAVRSLDRLAVRLRLGPRARQPNNQRRPGTGQAPPSAYDMLGQSSPRPWKR